MITSPGRPAAPFLSGWDGPLEHPDAPEPQPPPVTAGLSILGTAPPTPMKPSEPREPIVTSVEMANPAVEPGPGTPRIFQPVGELELLLATGWNGGFAGPAG